MNKSGILIPVAILLFLLPACSQNRSKKLASMNSEPKIQKSEEEWKALLTADQYYILRQKGTERAFTGK